MNIPHPPGCPACGSTVPLKFLEDHFDKIGGKPYRLFTCPSCGVVSTEPREPVGAEWYAKDRPVRHMEKRALAAKQGFIPTGFDYDERVAALARARGLPDAHAMEFTQFISSREPAEFDAATLFDVLEHTPEPAWFFGEVSRLIKPGGHVAITLPNGLRPVPWGREEHDFPPHHFTRWTPQAMKKFLNQQGYDVVRQDAGTLKIRYLGDHFFFYRVMPGCLKLARRLIFGRQAAEASATLTELCNNSGKSSGAMMSDKLRRQQLVNIACSGFNLLFTPVGFLMERYYSHRNPQSGDCLYTLARKRSK